MYTKNIHKLIGPVKPIKPGTSQYLLPLTLGLSGRPTGPRQASRSSEQFGRRRRPTASEAHGSVQPTACGRLNAGHQARREAAARHERRLYAVACMPLLARPSVDIRLLQVFARTCIESSEKEEWVHGRSREDLVNESVNLF